MRLILAVLILFIAYVASYPSFRDSATDNDENDAELELRAILNQLDEEQMTRSLTSEEDADDDESAFSKRQGGHNVIDKQSECEIKCIYTQRNPKRGKGKSVKDAAKACKQICPNPKKPLDKKKQKIIQRKPTPVHSKLSLREFNDDADDSQSNEESEEFDRRELYNYLMEQLQQNNDE